jgi:SOS response regulatory protein OraA/RecX
MPSEPRAIQRIGMYLMRRGFDAEVVRSTLRAASPDRAADEAADDA